MHPADRPPELAEPRQPRVVYSPQFIAMPPPPPVAHKVYILDCKACDAFMTNRAMKAVLLLRPNVPLYSTDAFPVNCSVYASKLSRDQRAARSSSSHIPPRTCECLTQTLCCHGCGAIVGYMIVVPCDRCTSSITATNRATNGHRFVFHSSQITATERHYIPDEPGVLPYETVVPDVHTDVTHFANPPLFASYPDPSYASQDHMTRSRSPSPATLEYPRTPPELVDSGFGSPRAHTYSPSDYHPYYPPPPPLPSFTGHHTPHPYIRSHSPSPHPYHFIHRPEISGTLLHSSFSFGNPHQEQKGTPLPRKLEAGDILFWHHLARTGEIPGIEDDKRARGKVPEAPASQKPVGVWFDR